MFSWTLFHVVLSKLVWDIVLKNTSNYFMMVFACHTRHLEYIYGTFSRWANWCSTMTFPKDRVTQLISSGARTVSQVPHSQAKIQRSGCVDNFLRIFQFCVISAGIYCNQQKPNVADLAKKEENGSMEAVRRKLKYPPGARPETRRVSGKWGKAPGLQSQDGFCVLKNWPSLNSVVTIQSPRKESDGHRTQSNPWSGASSLIFMKEIMNEGKWFSQRKSVPKAGEGRCCYA